MQSPCDHKRTQVIARRDGVDYLLKTRKTNGHSPIPYSLAKLIVHGRKRLTHSRRSVSAQLQPGFKAFCLGSIGRLSVFP